MKNSCTNRPFLILMQTARVIQEQIRLEMSKNGLGITEFSVLEVLYHKGKQTIQQIGTSILISSSSMTYVIDKLEQKNLIKRIDCPEDRRMIHVTLTDEGYKLMKEMMPSHEKFVDRLFESLSDWEKESLVTLLMLVKNNVQV